MNAIWLNIAIMVIMVIQLIVTIILVVWQIKTAKDIATDRIGEQKSILDNLRNFAVKHLSKFVIISAFLTIFIWYLFIAQQEPIKRIEILVVIGMTYSAIMLILLDIIIRLMHFIKNSHELLYCMICKRSVSKPVCIETINSIKPAKSE